MCKGKLKKDKMSKKVKVLHYLPHFHGSPCLSTGVCTLHFVKGAALKQNWHFTLKTH